MKQTNKKEPITEEMACEQELSRIMESISYLPEAEQEKFLTTMNEATNGGLKDKILGLFGTPEKSLDKLKKTLTDTVNTFTQILAAIDKAASLNPALTPESVEQDKAIITQFQAKFQELLTKANAIVPPPTAADKASTETAEAKVKTNEAGETGGVKDLNDEEEQDLMMESKETPAGDRA